MIGTWYDIPAGDGVTAATARYVYLAITAGAGRTLEEIASACDLSHRTTGQACRHLTNTGWVQTTHTTGPNGIRGHAVYEAHTTPALGSAATEQEARNVTRGRPSPGSAEFAEPGSANFAEPGKAEFAEPEKQGKTANSRLGRICRTGPVLLSFSSESPVKSEAQGLNQETSGKKKNQKSSARANEPPGFCEFWALYPAGKRKFDRTGALQKWRAKGLEEHAREINAGLRAWIKAWAAEDNRFVPMVATFLNQRRWEASPTAPEPEPQDDATVPDRDITDMPPDVQAAYRAQQAAYWTPERLAEVGAVPDARTQEAGT